MPAWSPTRQPGSWSPGLGSGGPNETEVNVSYRPVLKEQETELLPWVGEPRASNHGVSSIMPRITN